MVACADVPMTWHLFLSDRKEGLLMLFLYERPSLSEHSGKLMNQNDIVELRSVTESHHQHLTFGGALTLSESSICAISVEKEAA